MTERITEERNRFIEHLYDELNFKLRWLASRKLTRVDQVEEAVQTALVVLCEKADYVMTHPNPQGWLTDTLKYVVMAMNRKTARENAVIGGSLEDAHGHYHDDYHMVEYGDLLSPEDRELIEMVVVQRYTIPEAAQELGITTEACKKRKQRATKRMRDQLLGSGER